MKNRQITAKEWLLYWRAMFVGVVFLIAMNVCGALYLLFRQQWLGVLGCALLAVIQVMILPQVRHRVMRLKHAPGIARES